MVVRYLSLFTGIGGFEKAIHQRYSGRCEVPVAECLGYSEISEPAIKVYSQHYPSHHNLGDITKITSLPPEFKECDLIVGGFPCTNLSSMANIKGDNRGLQGEKSGLFYEMVRVIKLVQAMNPRVKFIVENNNSMKKANKETITQVLQAECVTEDNPEIFSVPINNACFGVQSRTRVIWTNFYVEPVVDTGVYIQTWSDVLEPLEDIDKKHYLSEKMVGCLNAISTVKGKGTTKVAKRLPTGEYVFETVQGDKSRWDIQSRSDNMISQMYLPYPVGKSRPITSGKGGGNNMIIDRRLTKPEQFIPRYFTPIEIERLFGFPDRYTEIVKSDKDRVMVLGNSVPIFIISHVMMYHEV